MEVEGREVVIEDNAEYEAMDVHFEFEEEGERSWSSFKYATIDFTVDDEEQQDELNRTVRLGQGIEKPDGKLEQTQILTYIHLGT